VFDDHLSGLRSLRRGTAAPLARSRPASVVLVGATCAGKSTIAAALRQSDLARRGVIEVASRFVTRPARLGDDHRESRSVTMEEFHRLAAAGHLVLHWVRHMENGRIEKYGCGPTAAEAIPVYLGGNGLYDHPESVQPPGVLDGALFLGLVAPFAVRVERLSRRSPDLLKINPAEVEFRLKFDDASVVRHSHVVADNHGSNEKVVAHELTTLLARVFGDSSH
jgi:hypothetical protein